MLDAYYTGFGPELDALFARPGIGWHYEAGMQIVRLILAGVFDRFPNLQIITGHWGEVVLFYLERLDLLSAPARLPRKVHEYVQQHVFLKPSGLFSLRYLRWSMELVGPERLLLVTDYPFVPTVRKSMRNFLKKADLNEIDTLNVASGSWDRLCGRILR